ncbi:PR domain zinc finger protein 1-like [Anabrus simplex]|uniref:PR domain zinc finger protein 1-like n=1 Tax=Anabrus simplex TaxID=316456 RepID=UPI0035A3CD11
MTTAIGIKTESVWCEEPTSETRLNVVDHVESFRRELSSATMTAVKAENEASPTETFEDTGLEVKTEMNSDNYGSSGPLPDGMQPVLFCSVAGGPVPNSNGISMRQEVDGNHNLHESSYGVEEARPLPVKVESVFIEYTCSICSKVFTDSCTLEKHLVSQDCVKIYYCRLCNEVFDKLSQLKEHNFNHNKEKKYICSLCVLNGTY